MNSEVLSVLALAKERLEITEVSEAQAEFYENRGIFPMDAVHLALASTAKADYFTTCDDNFLRKAHALPTIDCRVISVLNLVQEVIK